MTMIHPDQMTDQQLVENLHIVGGFEGKHELGGLITDLADGLMKLEQSDWRSDALRKLIWVRNAVIRGLGGRPPMTPEQPQPRPERPPPRVQAQAQPQRQPTSADMAAAAVAKRQQPQPQQRQPQARQPQPPRQPQQPARQPTRPPPQPSRRR